MMSPRNDSTFETEVRRFGSRQRGRRASRCLATAARRRRGSHRRGRRGPDQERSRRAVEIRHRRHLQGRRRADGRQRRHHHRHGDDGGVETGGKGRRQSCCHLRTDVLWHGGYARGGIRVVGDHGTTLEKVALLPGATPLRACLDILPGADVIVAGEVREWESVELVRDAITAGGRKGLILLGRVLSEDPGMNVCARWMKSVVPEITTTWIPAGDPYWRPI